MDVHATQDAAELLRVCGEFLASRPVDHNLVLTLAHARAARPEPGRYWWTTEARGVTSVLFQSPPTFFATITPATVTEVGAFVDALADEGTSLPGITGEAFTAAAFAGRWAERWRHPVEATEAQRLYRLGHLVPPTGVVGHLRPVEPSERKLLVEWTTAFVAETGVRAGDVERDVDGRIAGGRWWIWEDGGEPVSSALASALVSGVSRVGAVYTPPEHRGHGYAAACVAGVSRHIVDEDGVAILYTQLRNPVSNAVYQRLGYEAVSEVLSYRFV